MTYDELLSVADKENLIVREKQLITYNGRIKAQKVAIKKDLSLTEKKCVLAEELGHYYTTTGNILEQSVIINHESVIINHESVIINHESVITNHESVIMNRKQELHARMWAYNKLIGLTGIISAYKAGCCNKHEMAEHLEVSEEFLNEALECYRSKYGLYAKVDNYILYFEPLGVTELL